MGRLTSAIRWCLELVQELFLVLLITFLLLILAETIWEGSISSHLNLNYLLIIVIAVGVIAVLVSPERVVVVEKRRHVGRRDIIMMIGPGLAGAAIVWYKTQEIGWLSYVISAASGVMIILLSILVWGRGKEGANEKGNS